MLNPWLLPGLIFCARVTDVSIGTLRLLAVTRGRRRLAVVLGFFETLIWLLAISGTFAHLDNWVNVLAYAAGFAAGNALGMTLERGLAMGTQVVQLISRGSAHAVAERLRFNDMVVTAVDGRGRYGPVAICLAIVPRKDTKRVIAMAREVDPEVLVTVEDAASSTCPSPSAYCPGQTPMKSMNRLPAWALWNTLSRRRAGGRRSRVRSTAA